MFLNDSFTLLATSNSITVGGVSLPVVSVTATSNGAEPNVNGQFTVSRSGSTTSSLVVNYGVGGTATNGTDYQTLTGSVTIPIGSSSAPIAVTPIDDPSYEGNETVILTLSANAAYTVGSPNSATVTIVDNESPPSGPTITGSPSTVNRGSNVTASWSGIVSPTVRDWIGLYETGAANTAFVAWEYVSCSTAPTVAKASGSCGLTIPTNLAVGTYELRLLANDGFNVLATSGPLAVQ